MSRVSLPKQLLSLILAYTMVLLPFAEGAAAAPAGAVPGQRWVVPNAASSILWPSAAATPPAPEPAAARAPVPISTPVHAPAKRPLSGMPVAALMMQAPTLGVSVGYADNLRTNPNFPVPWQGSPNIVFLGAGPIFDAGAIRLDNNSSAPLAIDSVVVDLGRPGPTFNLWAALPFRHRVQPS